MTGVLDDLRSLPWLLACGVVLVAVVVMAIRLVALLVFVAADLAERGEVAFTSAVGIDPIAAAVTVVWEEPR